MEFFPPVDQADESGLLAIGGDFSVERLVYAYSNGIFPWPSGSIPEWYSPDPRFVLFPEELKVSKSMKQVLRSPSFTFTTNQAFEAVITNCSKVKREGQWGTWITGDMIRAYVRLHELGMASSAETWMDGRLVGGLYGVRVGRVFCGESMFSTESNASKYAFIHYVAELRASGVTLIDCQVYTPHLESLGARMISRKSYIEILTA